MDNPTTLTAGSATTLMHLVAARIQGEYREMPGLCLTLRQAERLFGVDATMCSLVFEQLTRDKFLTRSADGRFCQ